MIVNAPAGKYVCDDDDFMSCRCGLTVVWISVQTAE